MSQQSFEGAVAHKRQDNERATVSIACEVRQGTRPWRFVLLEDLSQTGFRMTWLPGMLQNVELRIRIPGLQVLSANVRWRTNNGAGCQFLAPLHIAARGDLLGTGQRRLQQSGVAHTRRAPVQYQQTFMDCPRIPLVQPDPLDHLERTCSVFR